MMEVLLAVARNDMLNAHLNTLQVAGLTPVAIDVEPLAVGRALLDLNKSNNFVAKNVVIVNIGATMTDVGVYKKGVLRFPRTIPIAGDNFTRAIADHLGLSLEQAEEEKRQHATVLMDLLSRAAEPFGDGSTEPSPFDFDYDDGNSGGGMPVFGLGEPSETQQSGVFNPYGNVDEVSTTPDATTVPQPSESTPAVTDLAADDPRSRRRREVFDALLPVLQEFAMEVRRSVDYFRSRYPSETVDQIILCGGSAKIGNLDRFMEYDLGVPTIVGDPLANATVIARNRNSELSPAFAVALGLAARDAVVGL
jgi:type IV pilus assembly protein PilM